MKTITTFILSIIGFISFSQSMNLVSADSMRVNLKAEPGVFSDVVSFGGQLALKVASSQSTSTPAFYMVSCSVREGAEYTYMVNAGPNSKGKVALYVTSPVGNIAWPGTIIKEGQVTQTFTAPAGANQVTLAIAFLYPQENDSVYLKTIGLFEGASVPSNWTEHHDADAMAAFLNEALKVKEAKVKEMEESNLATFYNLSEIKIDGDLQMTVEHADRGDFLKVTCLPSRYTPSVYFKTMRVIPGQQYTYFVSLSTKANLNAYVTMPSGNLVWPGVKLKDGISKQPIYVPEGVNEITLGFAFSAPSKDQSQTAIIENVGFYKGDVDLSLWNPSSGGLQPLLRSSYSYLLWFLFPIAIVILAALYIRSRKRRTEL